MFFIKYKRSHLAKGIQMQLKEKKKKDLHTKLSVSIYVLGNHILSSKLKREKVISDTDQYKWFVIMKRYNQCD